MSKHVSSRPAHLAKVKVVASVVLVVAFVTLFVGGAVGLIGEPDKTPADLSAVPPTATGSRDADPGVAGGADASDPGAPDTPPASSEATDPAAPSVAPTPVVTGVPPQTVTGSTKLKRSLEWLRRGLADETTFRVGTFNVLGNSHTAPGGNRKGWAAGDTRMGWAWSLVQQADLDVIGFQELEEPQYGRFM